MDLDRFILFLDKRLKEPLPGKSAQLKMSSLSRIREMMKYAIPEDALQSSVLILLYPLKGTVGLVLMLRPEYPGVHSGQISLPGGKFEDTDESLTYTALRESHEEIGVVPADVQVIGQLTELYIPPSNFMVTPVVGFCASRPVFTADPIEVAKIIEIEVPDLIDHRTRKMKEIKLSNGVSIKVPTYNIDGNTIWGATAMILSELEAIAGEFILGDKG